VGSWAFFKKSHCEERSNEAISYCNKGIASAEGIPSEGKERLAMTFYSNDPILNCL
jgi:hypothetical protein